MRNKGRLIAVGGMLVLSACAHSPPPAMLAVSQVSCDASPDMQRAEPIAYNDRDDTTVSAQFDGNSACLQTAAGAKSLYKIYRLPAATTPYSISVLSVATDVSVFVPRISILDSSGASVREIPRDSLVFRNGNLSALFRSHANDSYLLLASDADEVGKSSQQILETTRTDVFVAGTAAIAVHTGDDQARQLVYAHNGSVEITLSPIPAAH